MKMFVLDGNRITNFEVIDKLIPEIIDQKPDVIIVLGYKRRTRERIYHPLTQHFRKSTGSFANIRKNYLIIGRADKKETLLKKIAPEYAIEPTYIIMKI